MIQRLFMDAKMQFLSRIVVAGLMTMLPLFMRGHDSVQPAKAALPPVAVPLDSVAPPAEPSTVPVVPAPPKTITAVPPAADDRLPTEPLDSTRITSRFGKRVHPILHRVLSHDGVDLGADLNDPIHAVYDGVVTSAGWRGGYGNAVEIYHEKLGKKTLYGHMNAIQVRTGQPVAEGQVIGFAGTTGLSTGVHLHFGVEDNSGDWNDPMAFLDGLSDEPASTMIATAPAPAHSYEPTRLAKAASSTARRVKKHRNISSSVQVASTSARPKPSAKTPVVASATTAKPARDLSALQQRYAAAAQAASTYSALYNEGAVSRLDRDTRVATAKQLQAELQAAQ